MEIEFFCHPSESRRWYEYWRDVRKSWYTTLGLKSERLRPREQGEKELAHSTVCPPIHKSVMAHNTHRLYRALKREFNVAYDDKGAVGRRYRRQDEAGTPWCITIDGQTLQDNTVTIRDRDTTQQTRLPLPAVLDELRKRLQPA